MFVAGFAISARALDIVLYRVDRRRLPPGQIVATTDVLGL